MRRWPFIFIALLVTLAFGCVSEPKPVVKDTAHFDARNRLLSAGGVTNVYDALNNRIGQTAGTNTTVYVVNPNAQLPQVLMRIKNGVTNYYVYGGGLLYQVTETAAGTNTLTYHYDYRGSTIALSSDSGLVTDRIEYSAYGLTTYRVGTNDTPFLLYGRFGVHSDANGLLYMQARYYNPYLCRFISADPSGFSGGLNFYAYANGNPISNLDPFGLGALNESSVDLTWFNAPTVGQQQYESILSGFLNVATLGAYNSAYTAINGQDTSGNIVTPREQGIAAVMAGVSLIPVGNIERAGSEAAVELGATLAKAAESGESSALQGARLSEHLMQLEKYGSQGFKELESGSFRYYGDLKAASTPGEMSGARLVREWNPETGAKRTWYETLDHSGTVRSVRPETGGPKVHYIFDANGNYTGTR